MNKLIAVPYIVIRAYDPIEAMRIRNELSREYYTSRESVSPVVKIAGGHIVKGKKDLRKAVEKLEAQVRTTTNLPLSMLEYGTLYLQTCKRRTLSGDISEHPHAYFPADAGVEVFFISPDGDASYLGKGTLVDSNLVFLNYKTTNKEV